MERTFLEAFGLEKEQIDKILNQHSKEIGQKVNEIEGLKTQLQSKEEEVSTANKTINDLKKTNKDNESLQGKIDDYKNQIKKLQSDFEAEKIRTTVLSELRVAGAKDPELVYNLIDQNKLGLNSDGNVIGYEEQIKSLTEDTNRSYLFNLQDNSTEVVKEEPTLERGGYEPVQGEADVESIGSIMGRQFAEQAQHKESSAADFWASLEG